MIWISPFFKSPMKDFGYDVADYCDIDPIFGDLADWDRLISECQKRRIKVMIDMVLSHTSDEHPWFVESRSSRSNPKANWYVWAENGNTPTSEPNNWLSLFGGSAWQWDSQRDQWYLHNFLREQPDLNFHEPQVQDALLHACEFWLKRGVSGFRLDVCNFYFHNASLQDNPPRPLSAKDTEGVHAGNPYNQQIHLYDKDQPENLVFLQRLRHLVDKYPEQILMGEIVSDNSLLVMQQYLGPGRPLHTAYNFSLFTQGFNGRTVAEVLSEIEQRLPEGLPTWALGNHDVARFVSRYESETEWQKSAKCFLTFLFCLRGNVIVYQGDELGLEQAPIRFEEMQDPFGIAFYPEFQGRDGCRTPLPWLAERTGSPGWLPTPESHRRKAIGVQDKDPHSVLNFTRRLIRWRQDNPWLRTAPLEVFSATDATLVLRRRISATEDFVVAINGSAQSQIVASIEGTVTLPPFCFKTWGAAGPEF
jgi:alpha-glucosidase